MKGAPVKRRFEKLTERQAFLVWIAASILGWAIVILLFLFVL